MGDHTLIQKIEELSLNALPAFQTHLFDGWVLRFSDGYTKRANSINPLYSSNEELEQKIDRSEQFFQKRKLRVVYKITPQVFPNHLDQILEERGYLRDGVTSVQLVSLEKDVVASIHDVQIYGHLHERWFSSFCHLNNVTDNDIVMLKQMLSNIIPNTCYVMLFDDKNNVVACGRGVLEGDYIGLFDIITHEKHRNKGYGEKIILHILQWGKEKDAKHAYLQVVKTNHPALNLYEKLGFREEYSYFYRIKQ